MANLISNHLLARIVRTVEAAERNPTFFNPTIGRNGRLWGQTFLIGKTTGVAKGTTATVTIWSGTPGSEAATTYTVGAYNLFGATTNTGFVAVANNGFGNYIVQAVCNV